MIEIAGIIIAFLAALWPIIVFVIQNKDKTSLGPKVSLEIARDVPSLLKEAIITDSKGKCNWCKRTDDVSLYFVRGQVSREKITIEDLILLCPSCAQRISDEKMSVKQLSLISKILRQNHDLADRDELIRKLYEQAVKHSLSATPDAIVIAIHLCERVLLLNPLHEGAIALKERLSKISSESLARAAYKLHHTGYAVKLKWFCLFWFSLLVLLVVVDWIVNRQVWGIALAGTIPLLLRVFSRRLFAYFIVYILYYPYVLIHEGGHILVLFLMGEIVDSGGKRMSILEMHRHIEIDGLPLREGLAAAVSKNIKENDKVYFPTARVNVTKMRFHIMEGNEQ